MVSEHRTEADAAAGARRPGDRATGTADQGLHAHGATAAPAPEAATGSVVDPFWNVRFQALASATYHSDREAWLTLVGRLCVGASVVFGSAALAVILSDAKWLASAAALAATIAGAVNLVVAPAQAARDHRDLKRRYLTLVSELDRGTYDGPDKALGAYRLIAIDAPPTYEAARALAWNAVVRSHYPASLAVVHLFAVPDNHRWLRHLWRYAGESYPQGVAVTQAKP